MNTHNYEAFKTQMLREGYHEFEIAQLPGAADARDLDRRADYQETLTKKDWGTHLTRFESTEELQAAMRDPAYKVNAHYRERVAELLSHSDLSVGQDGVLAHGEGGLDEVTNESMIETARQDALRNETKRLFREAGNDPVKRWDLYRKIEAEQSAIVEDAEHAFTSEGPLQRAFRLAGPGQVGSDLSKAMAQEDVDQFDADGSLGSTR